MKIICPPTGGTGLDFYLTYKVLKGIAESVPQLQTSDYVDVGSRVKGRQRTHLQKRVI